LPCPATNPTASSLARLEAAVPEEADVPVLELPFEVSSGAVVATPEKSRTSKAVNAADPLCTVTMVVGAALAEYHISPFELCPATS
jgi:hypothetical protein